MTNWIYCYIWRCEATGKMAKLETCKISNKVYHLKNSDMFFNHIITAHDCYICSNWDVVKKLLWTFHKYFYELHKANCPVDKYTFVVSATECILCWRDKSGIIKCDNNLEASISCTAFVHLANLFLQEIQWDLPGPMT